MHPKHAISIGAPAQRGIARRVECKPTDAKALQSGAVMDSSGGQPCVGVFPRAARAQRNRMFDTLEQALEVRFVGRDYGEERALSAAIVWRDRDGRSAAGTLSALPQLTVCADGDRAGELRPVRLHTRERARRPTQRARGQQAGRLPRPRTVAERADDCQHGGSRPVGSRSRSRCASPAGSWGRRARGR